MTENSAATNEHPPSTVEHARACARTTAAGAPCRGRALPGSNSCFAHAPELASRRAEGIVRGGRNHSRIARARGLMPADLVAVLGRLESALERLEAGELSPRVASAMASLAGAIVRTWEAGVLESRLARIEEQLGEYGPELQ